MNVSAKSPVTLNKSLQEPDGMQYSEKLNRINQGDNVREQSAMMNFFKDLFVTG